jgi:hypothetical protein
MTASQSEANRTQAILKPVLEEWGLAGSINTIPIPYPFSEKMPADAYGEGTGARVDVFDLLYCTLVSPFK